MDQSREPAPTPTDCPPSEAEARNVRAIAELEERALAGRSWGERLGDLVARRIGSMGFVASHIIWFTVWIALNVGVIGVIGDFEPFDPFPFSFLTLVVSLESIFLSLFLLISQNRMTRQAEKRAHLDLQINLLAEAESTKALDLLRKVAERVGVELSSEEEEADMKKLSEKTDVTRLANTVDDKIPDGS